MIGARGMQRKRIALLKEHERKLARTVRWHLKPNGDLVEAGRALAWLLRARTTREQLEFDLAVIVADDAVVAKAGVR